MYYQIKHDDDDDDDYHLLLFPYRWATVEMTIVNGTAKEEEGVGGGGGRVIAGTLVNLYPFTRYAVYVKTVSLDSSGRDAQSEVMYATTSPYSEYQGCVKSVLRMCVKSVLRVCVKCVLRMCVKSKSVFYECQ